jgi:hypothetical protein
VAFPRHFLISEAKSKAFGLWLAEPRHFLHDPLPRAHRYLDRFPAPDGIAVRSLGRRSSREFLTA